MKTSLLELIPFTDLPLGNYKVIGRGDFHGRGGNKKFVILAGMKEMNGYTCIVHLPDGMSMYGKVKITQDTESKNILCTVVFPKQSPIRTFSALALRYGYFRTFTYAYREKKWEMIDVK